MTKVNKREFFKLKKQRQQKRQLAVENSVAAKILNRNLPFEIICRIKNENELEIGQRIRANLTQRDIESNNRIYVALGKVFFLINQKLSFILLL